MTRTHKTLAWNLILTVATGTGVCFWFWRNTDWFAELGALLTFSGILSWLAAVSKIVPDEKTKAFQADLYHAVFENPAARKWIGGALAGVLIGSLCFATVQLEPLQESVDRAVIVYPLAGDDRSASAGVAADNFETLRPGGRIRLVVPVWWGWQARFVVKVSGYPDKVIRLHPWQRLDLIVPNSLRRPVLLLRPTERLMNNARQQPWMLIVRREKTAVELQMPFAGHAVWLGADANVQVPQALRNLWGPSEVNPLLKPYWVQPKAFTNGFADLDPGERFFIQLRTANGTLQPASVCHVEQLSPGGEFDPQIVSIDSQN